MLQRVAAAYALLRDAAAADDAIREHVAAEINRRRKFQRKVINHLHANGPLREGLTPDQAADIYSALANPETYLLLTTHHGWTPDQFQTWLADSLQQLLLPPPRTTTPDPSSVQQPVRLADPPRNPKGGRGIRGAPGRPSRGFSFPPSCISLSRLVGPCPCRRRSASPLAFPARSPAHQAAMQAALHAA